MPSRACRRWAGALLVAVLLVAAACSGDDGGGDDTGLPTEPFDPGVEVGDCFDRPQSPDVTEVPILDCAEPHDFEAFALVELDGDGYPGDDQVATRARRRCGEQFADYVGVPPDESGLVIVPVAPTAEGWEAGDRTVTCTVTVRADEPLQGSVEGSERGDG